MKPSSLIDVQTLMVRLGKHFAWTALIALATACSVGQASAQTSTPPPTQPAASAKPAAAASTQATTPHKARTRHKKPAPVAEVPQTPPPPPTLEQQSPTAPVISYRNGQLTIDAPNSTLASILRAVQSQTGASMDIPSGANSERVATQIGPGLPRDVLNTLLNGSKFDYVILGVAGNPGAIQKVILTPRQAGGGATATQTASAPPPSSDESEDVSADAGGESEYPGPPEQVNPPGAFRRPGGAPGGQAFQQQQLQPGDPNGPEPFAQQNDPNIVKTPEQLMQELQQMQQQQQQYQEQLNPANQNPPQ